MFMMKISAVLAVSILTVCHLYSSQAAPLRPALDSLSDRVVLSDYEARRLLNAIVREFVQMTVESDQRNDNNSSVAVQKRACNTATCVTHRLADILSRTGPGGRKYVSTNVGSHAFGRRRRNEHA
ncbi:calcitonin gene-related peptide-like isoform X2 [Hemibagrus wyckioides]|uniref:calcitonin gene-related peptide-like isoform X2 n=1 Tax=Hemibagrus wyckioides TaxID=337641 RepID=UPI00266B7CD1|nr:calcitonin gene-related peptide-like isoform X2 [Hemibagrus wyckioides]